MAEANNKSKKESHGKLISFILPLYDEKESLQELHDQIENVMKDLSNDYELIFVDDGSTDGSFETLMEMRQRDPKIRIIQFRRNFGKAAAYMAGFRTVKGEIVVTMDSDLQDDPAELPKFLTKLDEGYDMVSGWKHKGKGSLGKALPSYFFNKVVSTITRIRLHDFNCPFKVYRREVVDEIEIYGELHRYIPVLAQTRGFSIAEVKISNLPRKFGYSKYGIERFLRGMFDLLTVLFITRFAKSPLHLLGITGILSTLFGSSIIAFFICAHFLYITSVLTHPSWNIHDRPAIGLGILLIIGGVQFFSIGLIGELIVSGRHSKLADEDYSVKRTEG